MERTPIHRWITLGLIAGPLFYGLVSPTPAWAELGGSIASIENDAMRLKGTTRYTAEATYRLHEIEAPTGHVVREYAGDDDIVFAVSWEGPTIPDLRQLLGERYFAEYQQAAAKRQRHGRGPVSIETPELIFQQSGRLRDFQGRAYLPAALPSGFDRREIR